MLLLLRRRSRHPPPLSLLRQTRSFIDARVPWVRDRGLDHAVEKEKHLLPFINVKDFLLLSNQNPNPNPSSPLVPLSSITPHASSLLLPFRPIRFLRLFPSAFLQEFPHHSPLQPHFRPSPSLLELHEQEQLAYSSAAPDVADRLLRLLMLCPRRRLPLPLILRLRFDIGLPRDFTRSLLPSYPDYFQLVEGRSPGDLDLELVCYRKDLAVSQMERYASRTGGYKKGTALAFHLQYPRGFEMEKKVRKWVEEWQRLPYVSPYEDGSRLPSKSDIWEKWAVGMVHELLSLMVPKKTEKANLEAIAPHVGLPASFRKMIMHHPGIFYLSNKLRTQTVVLREAYRRDLLVEKHQLMGLRYHYIHLMQKGKEMSGDGKKKKKKKKSLKGGDEGLVHGDEGEEADVEDDDEAEGDEGEEFSGGSDTEDEEDEDEDDESDSEDDESDDEDEFYGSSEENARRGPRRVQVEDAGAKRPFRSRRNDMPRKNNVRARSHGRGDSPRSNRRLSTRKRVST